MITTDTSNIKLPPINLLTFDGNYIHRRSFEDGFGAFANKNESLSDVQKLCYLRSQLKGEAFGVIKSLETTAQNYTITISLIREIFNPHRRIVYRHIKTLLNNKYAKLKCFINTVDQHIQCLDSLNISLQDSHALLIPILISKLEPKLSREWEIKIVILSRTVLPSYKEFRMFMLLQSETHDIINDLKEISKHFCTSTHPKLKFQTSSSVSVTCPVCKDRDFIYQFSRFLKQDMRIKTVKSLNLLQTMSLFTTIKIKTCGNFHNTLLYHDTQHPQNNSQEAIIP